MSVSDDGEHWFNRYFAKYENGIVCAWACGATSWSTDNKKTTTQAWKYVKLLQEGRVMRGDNNA